MSLAELGEIELRQVRRTPEEGLFNSLVQQHHPDVAIRRLRRSNEGSSKQGPLIWGLTERQQLFELIDDQQQLTDRVCAALREAITSGRLAPEERIKQERIAAERHAGCE